MLIILSLIKITYAEIPSGYYDNASGLSGATLKAALNNIIDGHLGQKWSSVDRVRLMRRLEENEGF